MDLTIDSPEHGKNSIFRNKNFILLWASQFLSQLGISFLNFVLVLSAYEAVRIGNKLFDWHISTNLAASYIVASYGVASFLFGAPAGVLVDYVNRKQTLIYTTLIRSVLVLFLIFYSNSLIGLIIFTFLLNSISQFFYPAEAAIIPNLVKQKQLLAANSVYNLTYFLSHITGLLCGGLSLYYLGFNKTIWLVATLFLLSAILINFIKLTEAPIGNLSLKKAYKLIFGGVRDGLVHIKTNYDTKISLIYLGLIQIIIGLFWALQPGLSVEVLNIQVKDGSVYIILPLVIGLIVGSIVINKYEKQISEILFVESGILLSSVAFLGIYLLNFQFSFKDKMFKRELFDNFNRIGFLPDINTITLGVLLMFLIGFACSFIFIVYNTKLQLSTADNYRGRIYGILQALVTVSGALPILLSGYIADKFGVKDVFLGMALFSLTLHLILKHKYREVY